MNILPLTFQIFGVKLKYTNLEYISKGAFNLTWKDDLATGVKDIDYQHKQLCTAIDRLLDACKEGKGRKEAETTMKFLLDYTKMHFAFEEKIQQKCGYPKYEDHKKLHTWFINEVQKLNDDVAKNGVTITTVSQINSLMLGWLLNHIKKVDKEIALYANK